MNGVFNLKMEVTVGENLLTGVSVKHHIHHITALCNEVFLRLVQLCFWRPYPGQSHYDWMYWLV